MSEVANAKLTKSLVAEYLGTFALVFIGAGAVIVESHTGMSHMGLPDGKVGLAGIAAAHGLTLTAMIYALGSVSGGHFNPAVSFAMWMQQRLESNALALYCIAQLAGGLTAGLLLAGIFPDEIALAKLGTPVLAAKFVPLRGALVEAVITMLLVMTVLFSTRGEKPDTRFAGLAIGGSLIGLILFAGPMTGGAANPVRFLGPALAAGHLQDWWVYLIGPLVGGGAASLIYRLMTDGSRAEAASAASEPSEQSRSDLDDGELESRATSHDETDEPSARPRRPATMPARPVDGRRLLAKARKLYSEAGRGKEAAAALVPMLARFEQLTPDVRNSLRTLLIVIEEDTGTLGILDEFRHHIYAR